ncbi:hypothetical protein ABZP36_031210 [Zizania latifolia]
MAKLVPLRANGFVELPSLAWLSLFLSVPVASSSSPSSMSVEESILNLVGVVPPSSVTLLLSLSLCCQGSHVVVPASLNTLLGRWGKKASPEWNISGELCSGKASDKSNWDDYPDINPFIKCDCSFTNNTVCRITKLYVYTATSCLV